MSTNQERRAEARQRLREQMETQARREKQLKIGAAAVVVVVLAGIVGVVVWNNVQQSRAEEYAANWATCEYPLDPPMEAIDPAQMEAQGAPPGQLEAVETFNEALEEAGDIERFAEPPTGDQPRHGTTEMVLALGGEDVPVTLDHAGAPCNVGSFVHLAQQQYFEDTVCHRLTEHTDAMPLGVLQCGDPTGSGLSGPGYTIVDEPPADLETSPETGAAVYPRGTVAMAKSASPNSGGSQFFLVYEDSELPPEYTVLGTIAESGLDVLDEIAERGAQSDDPAAVGYQTPTDEVTLDSVELLSQAGLPEE